jgi:hypothetical protein
MAVITPSVKAATPAETIAGAAPPAAISVAALTVEFSNKEETAAETVPW